MISIMSRNQLVMLFSLVALSFIGSVESVEMTRKAIYSTASSKPLSSYLNKGAKNKLAHAFKRPTYATDSNQFAMSAPQGGLSVQDQTSSSVGSGVSITNSNGNSNSNEYSYNQPSNSQGSSFTPTYTSPPPSSSSSSTYTNPPSSSGSTYTNPPPSSSSSSTGSSPMNVSPSSGGSSMNTSPPSGYHVGSSSMPGSQPVSNNPSNSNPNINNMNYNYNQPSNFAGSSFMPTYINPSPMNNGQYPLNGNPIGNAAPAGIQQPANHPPTYGNGVPPQAASSVVYSLTPPADYSSNSIYSTGVQPSGSNGMASTYDVSPSPSSSGSGGDNGGYFSQSSSTPVQGVPPMYSQQGGNEAYPDNYFGATASSSSNENGGAYYSSGVSTSQGTLYGQQGGDADSSGGSNSYYAASSGGGTTSQGTQYNQQGTGSYPDNNNGMYYAQPSGSGGDGLSSTGNYADPYYAGTGSTPSQGNLYNQQGTVPYSEDTYLGSDPIDGGGSSFDQFPESSFVDTLPPVSPIPDYGSLFEPVVEELPPDDFAMEGSNNEGTYAEPEYENPMTEDEALSADGDGEDAEEEAAEAPVTEAPAVAAPAPAPAASSADNNPLTFLNLVGSDFQPGRLVNIFFGLFIMLFMIIIHGYSLWVLGIAYLPGTRSLNQWELQGDRIGDILSTVIDSIEFWENRV